MRFLLIDLLLVVFILWLFDLSGMPRNDAAPQMKTSQTLNVNIFSARLLLRRDLWMHSADAAHFPPAAFPIVATVLRSCCCDSFAM